MLCEIGSRLYYKVDLANGNKLLFAKSEVENAMRRGKDYMSSSIVKAKQPKNVPLQFRKFFSR